MTSLRPPEKGLLGIDLLPGIDVQDFLPDLPGAIGDAINETVGKILNPNDDSIKIGDPQPAGERPIPTTDPKELSAAVQAIDAALGGIKLLLRFGFLIPDNYEDGLRKLAGALNTVRGWLI